MVNRPFRSSYNSSLIAEFTSVLYSLELIGRSERVDIGAMLYLYYRGVDGK